MESKENHTDLKINKIDRFLKSLKVDLKIRKEINNIYVWLYALNIFEKIVETYAAHYVDKIDDQLEYYNSQSLKFKPIVQNLPVYQTNKNVQKYLKQLEKMPIERLNDILIYASFDKTFRKNLVNVLNHLISQHLNNDVLKTFSKLTNEFKKVFAKLDVPNWGISEPKPIRKLRECSICNLPLIQKEFIQLSCNHSFHQQCLIRRRSTKCPICGKYFV